MAISNGLEKWHWKKGQSGNPGGAHKMPEELKAIKRMDNEEVHRRIAKYLRMGFTDLLQIIETCKMAEELRVPIEIPSIDLMICSIIVQAIKKGDEFKLDMLLGRVVGKSPPGLKAVIESGEVDYGPWSFPVKEGEGA